MRLAHSCARLYRSYCNARCTLSCASHRRLCFRIEILVNTHWKVLFNTFPVNFVGDVALIGSVINCVWISSICRSISHLQRIICFVFLCNLIYTFSLNTGLRIFVVQYGLFTFNTLECVNFITLLSTKLCVHLDVHLNKFSRACVDYTYAPPVRFKVYGDAAMRDQLSTSKFNA